MTSRAQEVLRDQIARWPQIGWHVTGGKKFLSTLEKKHGKGKALSILAHTIGRSGLLHLVAGHRLFDGEVQGGVAGSRVDQPDEDLLTWRGEAW
jgi:hypothetical protein